MDANIELKNHISVEFRYHRSLNETRGVMDGIGHIVDVFIQMVKPQFQRLYESEDTTITETYDSNNAIFLNNHKKMFFEHFLLTLVTQKSEKKGYKGGLDLDNVKHDSDFGFIIEPNIQITIKSPTYSEAIDMFSSTFAHEITHGYNMLQYALKNNKIGTDNVMLRNRYSNIINAKYHPNHSNLRAIGEMLYNLSRLERNAYIAQLRQELYSMKDDIFDATSAYEAIKKTSSYKHFLYLEENMNILNGKVFKLTNDVKDDLRISLNSTMGTHFTNFEQFLKYFNRRWDIWKKTYLTKASKIAYDIYSQYHHKIVDDNMSEALYISNTPKK